MTNSIGIKLTDFKEHHIYTELFEYLYKNNITLITGMIRTGKKNLVKKLIEEFGLKCSIYFHLERIANRELVSEKLRDELLNGEIID